MLRDACIPRHSEPTVASATADPAWQQRLATTIRSLGSDAFWSRLLDAVSTIAPIDSAVVCVYRRRDVPTILFDKLLLDERQSFYETWLRGAYLVSPFYKAFYDRCPPGLYTIRELAPDRFQLSQYYRRYYAHIGAADLAGYLTPLADGQAVLISIGRRGSNTPFARRELSALRRVEPVIAALVSSHALTESGASEHAAPTSRRLHEHFQGCFESFGRPALTQRENEVVRLLLRGHSSKSVALELAIAVETVRVHRKNIYAKLGVSTQGDLFALFIATLSS